MFKGWYENGQLKYEHPYVNGKLHGMWKDWDKNGQLSMLMGDNQTIIIC